MESVNLNTRIIDLTVGELMELLGKERTVTVDHTQSEKRFVYGIAGIARLFNCSMATANRIKKSGVIDPAITQYGRMITVDADMALDLLKLKQ